MLEDHSYDFDRQVKSLLESAEVKAPKRVWRGVAGRLDAAEAASAAAAGWWRWAGAGLAFAAALVAGVFVLRSPSAAPSGSDLLAVRVIEAPEDQVFESIPAPQPLAAMGRRQASKPAAVAEQAVAAQEPEQAAKAAEAAQDAVCKSDSEEEVSDGSAARLLAQLGWEESRSQRSIPKSVMVGGALGGNESHFNAGSDHRSFMAYGEAAHSQTSVEETSTSAYDIPVALGASVRFQLSPRFSVGTGLTYTLLGRRFDGVYTEVKDGVVARSITGEVSHKMQYLGIPVNAYYDFMQSKFVDLYAYAGGSAEYCVSNKYLIEDVVFSDPVSRLQFSLGAGLGLQFKLGDALGIYFDPGVHYYFRCDQPKSVRTDKPFTVSLEAGLRFNLH